MADPGQQRSFHSARGLGEIAAAIGVQSDRSLPQEFEIALGDLLQRAPSKFVWPGKHDPLRILLVPAAEITAGLAKGRAEISVARLVALAPDVFRWERDDLEDPRVLLPLQKLLRQIGSGSSGTRVIASAPQKTAPPQPAKISAGGMFGHDLPHGPADHAGFTAITEPPAEVPSSAAADLVMPAEAQPEPPAVPPEREQVVSADETPELAPDTAPQAPRAVAHISPQPTLAPSVELRPQSTATASTTLHAVVLGGRNSTPESVAYPAMTQTLAPRVPPPTGGIPSVILAPAGCVSQSAQSVAPTPPMLHGAEPQETGAKAAKASPERSVQPPPTPENRPNFAALQRLFMTDAPLGPVGVAAKTAALPGIMAVWIEMPGTSAQAGKFPAGLDTGTLASIVEDFRSRHGNAVESSKPSGTGSVMVRCGDNTLAAFVRDNVALTVVLEKDAFVTGVRERLACITGYLGGAECFE